MGRGRLGLVPRSPSSRSLPLGLTTLSRFLASTSPSALALARATQGRVPKSEASSSEAWIVACVPTDDVSLPTCDGHAQRRGPIATEGRLAPVKVVHIAEVAHVRRSHVEESRRLLAPGTKTLQAERNKAHIRTVSESLMPSQRHSPRPPFCESSCFCQVPRRLVVNAASS